MLGASPAAGANFSVAVPGEFEQALLSITFQLVTDATAANRFVELVYTDGNNKTFYRSGLPGAVTASTTATFCFAVHPQSGAANTGNQVYAPLAPLVLVPPNTIGITVTNIQATDQLSAIVMRVARFQSGTHSATGFYERLRAARGED